MPRARKSKTNDRSNPVRRSARNTRPSSHMVFPGENESDASRSHVGVVNENERSTIQDSDMAGAGAMVIDNNNSSASGSNVCHGGGEGNTSTSTSTSTMSISPEVINQITAAVIQAINKSTVSQVTMREVNESAVVREIPANLQRRNDGGAEAIVQESITSVVQSVAGEVPGAAELLPQNSQPDSVFRPMSVPIDAMVSPKLKAKIWSHEYIEFGLLLNNSPSDQRYQLTWASGNNSAADGLPRVCLEPANKVKQIYTIDAWLTAFQIFVSVYTSKYQTEAPGLMKYAEVVRDLAGRGANWKFYDTNFRYLKQKDPAELPWGAVNLELWIRAINFSGRQNKAYPNVGERNTSFVPYGFCRRYHTGKSCSGCSYKHSCFKCQRNHPALRCNFRASGTSGSQQSHTQARSSNSNQSK